MKKLMYLFIVCFFVVTQVFSQVNLTQGLVAYYPFSGNANDASGNNNNPIFNNATLTADRNGNANSAYHFNGVDNYIEINNSNSLNPSNSISISAWVKPMGFYKGLCHGNRVIMKGDADFLPGNYTLTYDDNAYTNGNNCNNSIVDTIHQTAYGVCAGNTSTFLQKNNWYLLTYTDDGTTCNFYINCKLEATTASSNSTFTNSYNLFLGKLNNTQYPYWFNGDMDEVRIYNRALNYEEVLALNDVSKADFSFSQNICNPKELTFKNEAKNYSKFYWQFDNGTQDSTNVKINTTFSTLGNHSIKLITANNFGCYDTVSKTIAINPQSDTNLIVSQKNITICKDSSVKLNVQDSGLAYCWSTSNGSITTNSANITVAPSVTTTYYYNTQLIGNNLIVNGDFESGNTGFQSDYTYHPSTAGGVQGIYNIGTNPNTWLSAFSACKDHTTNSGNMMMIDGSTVANTAMWKQTVNVQPNINYVFSGWVQSIVSQNPAQLVFKINGNVVGTTLTANLSACSWKQFSIQWNSGNTTSANLSIVDNNLVVQGNDFAIDDIVFAPVNIKTDSVNVAVNNCAVPIASFTAPDTVCVNTPITINNTSTGATTYNWNFCNSDLNAVPNGFNLGNISSNLSSPVFMDYVLEKGNYYAFVVNHNPGEIVRLDFGNSLLNTPTSVNLGNIGGVMNVSRGSEGIQIIKNNGKYFIYVVGGSPSNGMIPKLLRFEFGSNITNTNPIATDFGNIGNLRQSIDLFTFQDNGNWYGFTVNSENNTLTRFDFTNDLTNTPTVLNLGNIANLLNYPTGICALNDNGFWRVFITNGGGNSDIIRLDFGNSLLNSPTGVSLGNPNNTLKSGRDLIINNYCNGIVGFVVNGGDNTITRLNFNSLSSTPSAVNLGNLGNFNFPHSLAKLFRVGSETYSFVTNVNNNTITRLKFSGCTNSSIPNSSSQTPPPISYNTAGTYNINLTIDEGLPTQRSFCKQVVVKNCFNTNCKGVVKLSGHDRVTPPQANFKKYFPATGFTWETWFNGSYFDNSNTTSDTRSKLIAATDIPSTTQDIVLGFGWPQVAKKSELCFVVDGPNGNSDRDNSPCTYFPTGGFLPNTWYHVAGVRDYANNTSKLYVNGVLVDSKTNNHQPLNPNSNIIFPNFYFGSMTGIGNVDSGFAGKMDEIRIWNYPRTATEIQVNFDKCLSGNETGLVAYYHSNEGKGTTLKDASLNKNNATLTNNVVWDKTDNAPLTTTCYQSTFTDIIKTICYKDTFQNHTASGVYNDTLTSSNGCDSIVTLHLTVLSAPTIVKDTLKGCGTVIFNGISYSANTVVTTSLKNYVGCDSIITQHQIIITNKRDTITKPICFGGNYLGHTSTFDTTFKVANNCDSIVTIIIQQDSYIKDSITKSICGGETYFGYNITGIYRDTFHTATCDSIRTLNLIVSFNLNPKLQQDTSICNGDVVTLYPGNYKKYLWSTGSIASSIKVKDIGLYWVEVSDSIGCKARDSFQLLNVFAKPPKFLPQNHTACIGELFSANDFRTYLWITGETTQSIALNGLNKYWLKVTDNNGCSGLDTMKVTYLGVQNTNDVTAFSPNGDGINEEFKPFNSSCLLQYKLSIYNRWGQQVFQTTNPNKGWNGNMNGKPLPTDVYYFIINYKTVTGISATKSGSITLLR